MGIGSEVIDLVAQLRLDGLIRKKTAVVEIGAQQLAKSFLDSADRLQRLGCLFGIKRPMSIPSLGLPEVVHGDLPHLDTAAPAARDFWRWLGFEYAAIDIDGSPDSIPLDLNFDGIAEASVGKYALVTNFGTTEHVVNQLNAFKVIHDLTAVNGLMIHRLPAQGNFNHGLVNYNFKFFWMLARSNAYKFVTAEYGQSPESYNLPDNIVEFLASLEPHAGEAAKPHKAADAAIGVVMQKLVDMPFVPPLDVATGTQTGIEALRQRYWTVFDPDALQRRLAQLNPSTVRSRVRKSSLRLKNGEVAGSSMFGRPATGLSPDDPGAKRPDAVSAAD